MRGGGSLLIFSFFTLFQFIIGQQTDSIVFQQKAEFLLPSSKIKVYKLANFYIYLKEFEKYVKSQIDIPASYRISCESVLRTVKSGNFSIWINFDNRTSIHIIPPGYLIN